jgi:cellulose 1,4-beta-cellobiosidase
MSRRGLTGALLLVALGACAQPTAPEVDAEPPQSPVKGMGGSAGKGAGGLGGGKATAGSAGKAPVAGKSSSGTGGDGGSGDGGSGDGTEPESGGEPATHDPGPSTAEGDLVLQYRAGNASANDNQIGAHLRIVSKGLAPVDLSTLSARYYFTSEPAPPLTIEIYTTAAEGTSGYRALPSGSVVATAKDEYVELTFTAAAGLLDAGGLVTIEIAIHDTGWSGLFDETNDYSFNASQSTFAAWDKVTLYDAKKLVWGVEPP